MEIGQLSEAMLMLAAGCLMYPDRLALLGWHRYWMETGNMPLMGMLKALDHQWSQQD